ncbi:MAG: hypothetical protein CR961_00310, partial [Polaribacter sp.]
PKEAGVKENNGCPWGDADKDGIKDNVDKCPKVAGVKENNGCPAPKKVEKAKVIEKVVEKPNCSAEIKEINNTEVYFDNDRVVLREEAKAKLNKVAGFLKSMKCNVEIVFLSGFASLPGSKAYNLRLSNRRAMIVKQYLQNAGLSNIRINAEGLGETNSNKVEGLNRRVEIRVRIK